MGNCLRWTLWMAKSISHSICSFKRKLLKQFQNGNISVCDFVFSILFHFIYNLFFSVVTFLMLWSDAFSIWPNIRNDETFEFSKYGFMNKTCWWLCKLKSRRFFFSLPLSHFSLLCQELNQKIITQNYASKQLEIYLETPLSSFCIAITMAKVKIILISKTKFGKTIRMWIS